MNAGRGRANHSSIYDYVESVTHLDGDQLRSASPAEIVLDYRQTIFTGRQEKLILTAVFKFPPATWEADPIEARMQWAKEHQDLGAGNCGTVFKQASGRLMAMLQGVRLGSAAYSRKTGNWISNHGKSPRSVLSLIWMAKLLHWITLRRIKLEWIEVD
jgi:UDP-N-acetylmuramate dehydrogenase